MDRWEYKQQKREARACRRTSRSGSLVMGSVIVLAGLALLLDNLGFNIPDIWRFWPVALIAVGAARIAESQRPASLVWGGLIAGIGALFLLDNLNIFHFSFHTFWPAIVIAFGVSMLLRSVDQRRGFDGNGAMGPGEDNASNTVSLWAVFGGGRRTISSHEFRGGEIFAVFGGFHLDLRGAQIAGGQAVLEVNAIFGGVEITTPANWRVMVKGMGIFGGFEDKTLPPPPLTEGMTQPLLVLTGSSIFGGATIRN